MVLQKRSKALLKSSLATPLCSPFIHRSSHLIIKDNHIGQALFTLGKSTLSIPDHLLLHVPTNKFQEDQLHNFLRTDIRPIDCLPWIVLLILFFPVNGDLLQPSRSFKDETQYHCNDTNQLSAPSDAFHWGRWTCMGELHWNGLKSSQFIQVGYYWGFYLPLLGFLVFFFPLLFVFGIFFFFRRWCS